SMTSIWRAVSTSAPSISILTILSYLSGVLFILSGVLEQRRGSTGSEDGRILEFLEDHGFQRAHLLDIGFLHMAVAANLPRQRGKLDSGGIISRRQAARHHEHLRFIMVDQAALHLALLRIAENVEGGAAQPLEAR